LFGSTLPFTRRRRTSRSRYHSVGSDSRHVGSRWSVAGGWFCRMPPASPPPYSPIRIPRVNHTGAAVSRDSGTEPPEQGLQDWDSRAGHRDNDSRGRESHTAEGLFTGRPALPRWISLTRGRQECGMADKSVEVSRSRRHSCLTLRPLAGPGDAPGHPRNTLAGTSDTVEGPGNSPAWPLQQAKHHTSGRRPAPGMPDPPARPTPVPVTHTHTPTHPHTHPSGVSRTR
jgi:hypothetical protein